MKIINQFFFFSHQVKTQSVAHDLSSGPGHTVPPFCGWLVMLGVRVCFPVLPSHVDHSLHVKAHGSQGLVLSGGHACPPFLDCCVTCVGCVCVLLVVQEVGDHCPNVEMQSTLHGCVSFVGHTVPPSAGAFVTVNVRLCVPLVLSHGVLHSVHSP